MQVLYATVQGVLYVLCYCLEHIFKKPAGTSRQGTPSAASPQYHHGHHAQQQQQNRQRAADLLARMLPPVLGHVTDPLSVCLPSVVVEFQRIVQDIGLHHGKAASPAARAAGWAPTHPPAFHLAAGALAEVFERRRQQAAAAARGQHQGQQRRPLEMFFPFDPYLLQRSARFLRLQETYVVWKGGHPGAAHRQAPACGPLVGSGRWKGKEVEEETWLGPFRVL